MNIEQYRALKAQETQQTQQVEQPAVVEVQVETPVVTEQIKEEQVDKPSVVKIDGKEVPIEELTKGYLRQQDYTKKTQELSHQKKEVTEALDFYSKVKANPNLLNKEALGQVPQLDPVQAKIKGLEEKLYDMMLQQEINTLQSKYNDFEVMEVISIAGAKGLTNLEDAYKIWKSTQPTTTQSVDVVQLEKELREKIISEMEAEKDTTKSIISTNSQAKIVTTSDVQISPIELKVAQGMGMSAEDYIKWRDIKN